MGVLSTWWSPEQAATPLPTPSLVAWGDQAAALRRARLPSAGARRVHPRRS